MTIQECYEQFGGDYNNALKILQMDALVERFAKKFLTDPSFSALTEALENGQTDNAFRAAHSLKGVAGNLSFAKLYSSACEITELLRAGNLDDAKEYYPTVQSDYNMTVDAIKQLD